MADRLRAAGHMSPFEHVARPMAWGDAASFKNEPLFGTHLREARSALKRLVGGH